MKLYGVSYMDDCDIGYRLAVGNLKEEVEERMDDELSKELACFMYCYVSEISEIDGHKILVE